MVNRKKHMSKMKTKKIVRNRFKITKTGKVMHRAQGARHLRSQKNKARQRRQDEPKQLLTVKYSRMVKHFLQT
jgi:large subunit ribosomal protein L35